MTLPAEDHSVRLARHAAHVVLGAWRLAHMEETAVLIVAELVSNAVRHCTREYRGRRGGPACHANLSADRDSGRDRRWPQPRIPAGFEESGFGFVLVDALAAKWGVRETATGKAVWAELDARGRPAV